MSDSQTTEVGIPEPTQPIEPEVAPVEVTRAESETSGSPAPGAVDPAPELTSEAVTSDLPALVEATPTPALAQGPVAEAVEAPATLLETPREIAVDPSAMTDAVLATPEPESGSASREIVAAEAEQASSSALITESTPERMETREPGSEPESPDAFGTNTDSELGAPPSMVETSPPTVDTTPAVQLTTPDSAASLQPASAPGSEVDTASAPATESLEAPEVKAVPDATIINTTTPDPESEPVVIERPRSEKLWFYDGNIVIQTPVKQYRIHRSVLAMHSTFFRDMFELPPATGEGKQANPMLEGCPVVEVPDAAEDWDAVLSIIYHTWESSNTSGDQVIPVDIMLAMLRLGHKYDFERVRNDALRQLKAIFPDDLKACDAHFCDTSLFPVGKFAVMHVLHSFKMVATAVDLSIETVLPSAYAMVLRHVRGMNLVLEGRDLEDEEPVLLQETRNTIVIGDRSIMNDSFNFLFHWLRSEEVPAGDKCQFPENCADELVKLLRKYPDEFPGVANTSYAVLRPLTAKTREQMSGLCIPCFNAAIAAYDDGREQMFEYLPSYFMMLPWDELKDFHAR